jgi:di/tripeptidase
MIQQQRFTESSNRFISIEAHFPNNYLLNKKIDAKNKKIILVFGGKEILPTEIAQLQAELKKYSLGSASLEINQGFAYLSENKTNVQDEKLNQLTVAFTEKEKQEKKLQSQLDSIKNLEELGMQVYAELKAQYPALKNAVIQPTTVLTDSSAREPVFLVLLSLSSGLSRREKIKMENWLKVRLQEKQVKLIFQ